MSDPRLIHSVEDLGITRISQDLDSFHLTHCILDIIRWLVIVATCSKLVAVNECHIVISLPSVSFGDRRYPTRAWLSSAPVK
jgi:hypothetical protein